MSTKTNTITFESLIAHHADDIAFVAEEAPASEISDFISQLDIAVERMEDVGITLVEEAGPAAVAYLTDAQRAETALERQLLLKKARHHLRLVGDAADEYRDMV